jgi:O-antigen/teichoic acid export membrane protein
MAGYAFGLLLALGSAPLIFRHLGVAEFGRYSAVLSLVTLAIGFSEGGLNAIALREWSTLAPDRRRVVMANLLGVRIGLTLIALAIAIAFAAVAGYRAALIWGTAIAGVGLLVQTVQTLLASPLQAELRFGWATIADLLRQVALVAFIVVLVLGGAGVVPLLAAQLPAGLAALALTVWLVRRDVPLRPRFDASVWWPLVRDSLPYALAIALNIAYFRVAILYMSVAATDLETGYFAASFRIVEVLIAVPPVLLAAAFPILARAARDDAERFAYATRRVLEVALLVGGLGAVGLVLGARIAVDILAGSDYEAAVPILHIQAPAILATFVAVACSYPLLSLRRHREVLLATIVGMAVTLVALITLVGPLAGRGAAIATLTAEFAVAATLLVFLTRSHSGLRLPVATATWVLGAGAGAIGLARLSGLPDLAQVVLGVALYSGVLVLARRIPKELLEAVRR